GAVHPVHPSQQCRAAARRYREPLRARAPVRAPAGRRVSDRALLARLCAGPASGAALARELGISRAAVWKRIESLRAAGVDIAAAAGSGYRLARPLQLLDADALAAALSPAARTELAGLEVLFETDSTNALA